MMSLDMNESKIWIKAFIAVYCPVVRDSQVLGKLYADI
jgi:hypothetical protein